MMNKTQQVQKEMKRKERFSLFFQFNSFSHTIIINIKYIYMPTLQMK
jgi:hypothetical protein